MGTPLTASSSTASRSMARFPALPTSKACLTEEGIEIPEDLDPGFLFELKNEEGLAEALEACGLPSFGHGFSFDGELAGGLPVRR